MPLSLAEYLSAIPDLEFPQALHRVGTCPACGNYGLTLRLLDLDKAKGISPFARIYEPWCPHGCTWTAISLACEGRLAAATVGGD